MRPLAITFNHPLAWPAPWRYGAAAVLVLLAVGLRWMIAPTEHGLAFVTVYPAVLVACFALGLGPGALVATVGGLAGTYFFLAPHYTFAKPPATYLNVLFYALTCTLVSLIVHALHRSAWHLRHALAEIEVRRDQLEHQVEERTIELRTAKEEAESATLAKAAFLANVSHEIRTPLNAIVGLVHILRRSGASREQEPRLDRIETSVKHVLEIVNSVLDLSKIEAGHFQLDEQVLDLQAMATDVLSILGSDAAAKGLEVRLEFRPLPTHVMGDSLRLQQALLNYGVNAIKFTASGSVTVRIAPVAETGKDVEVRFEVEDTGIGIEPDKLSRLFAPFEQGDMSITRAYGGTGLGLVITRRLARLMGGDAGASSRFGRGSVFWFTVSLRKALLPPAEHHEKPRADAEQALRGQYAGCRVLLVEDDLVNREITLELLRSIWPMVDSADDGVEAVAAVERKRYDLILMDMQMPRMDGLSATRSIRALANGKRLPILALTANAFVEDRQQCHEAGMNDFLAKPIVPSVLYDAMLTWLAKAESASTASG
jgi:signal transduction histidine kinase/ActR/RegA family two-component response regulator